MDGLRDISVSLLPDGRVLCTLRNRRGGILDLREGRVDTDDLSELAQEWASVDWARETPNPDAGERWRGTEYREYHDTLLLVVGARGTSLEFSQHRHTLTHHFAEIFGDVLVGKAPPPPSADAVTKFSGLFPVAVRATYQRLKAQVHWRAADGRYLPVLESYLAELRSPTGAKDQHYYAAQEHTLIAMLRGERYLLMSPDARLRRVYRDIEAEISSLYNWYMDLARGGVARAR